MKYLYTFIIFFIGFLLQSTLMNIISVLGVTPNLVLCIAIVVAFLFDDGQSLIFGVLFGLIQDICFGKIVGIAAFCYLMIMLIADEAKRLINRENMLSAIILTIGGTFIYNVLYWVMTFLFDGTYSVMVMLRMQPIAIVYNVVVTIVLYLLLIRKVVKHPSDKYIKGRFKHYG